MKEVKVYLNMNDAVKNAETLQKFIKEMESLGLGSFNDDRIRYEEDKYDLLKELMNRYNIIY